MSLQGLISTFGSNSLVVADVALVEQIATRGSLQNLIQTSGRVLAAPYSNGTDSSTDVLSLAITKLVASSKLLITASVLCASAPGADQATFTVLVDGAPVAQGTVGAILAVPGLQGDSASFSDLITGLSVGSHTVTIQLQNASGETVTIVPGSGIGFASITIAEVRV